MATPPSALKTAISGVVQAGQPGVKAIRALPNAVEPPPCIVVSLGPFILYTSSDTLIPVRTAVPKVSAIDAMM